MQVNAIARYIRMSPTKVRLVAELIKGMSVEHALAQISVSAKHAKFPLKKLVDQAIANATHNFNLEKASLRVASCQVQDGPMLRRYFPRAMGKANIIRKRSCHIYLVLSGEPAAEAVKPVKAKSPARTSKKTT